MSNAHGHSKQTQHNINTYITYIKYKKINKSHYVMLYCVIVQQWKCNHLVTDYMIKTEWFGISGADPQKHRQGGDKGLPTLTVETMADIKEDMPVTKFQTSPW